MTTKANARATRTNTTAARRPDPRPSKSRRALLPVDAEDLAMERLQAALRETEAGPASPGRAARPALRRASVMLPLPLLERARSRASREAATLSDLVRRLLEQYLASR